MENNQNKIGFLDRSWKILTSMNFTITMFLSLALSSIIGTLIPQNAEKAAYIHEYGETIYSILSFFNIFDLYHSWWFQFLLLMLTISILLCSFDRLKATWKVIFPKNPKFNVSRFQKSSIRAEFATPLRIKEIIESYEPIVSKNFGYSRIEHADKGLRIFAEKGRWTRLGVYIVHSSVILLLFGALLGSIFGFEGFVNIPEGQSTKTITMRKTGKPYDLNFDIRCDDFDVSFYESGVPREYRSKLTIIENGQEVLKKAIVVNDPLRYKGINIFQSSYGIASPESVVLAFNVKKSGNVYTKKVSMGEEIDIGKGLGTFIFRNFVESFNFRGHDIGPSVIGTLNRMDQEPRDIVLPINFERFDMMRGGDIVISVKDMNRSYYTGLQVTSDPGVPIVYVSFIAMLIGFYITFFMYHQMFLIEVLSVGRNSKVIVTALANKNRLDMENKTKKLSDNLKSLLQKRGA